VSIRHNKTKTTMTTIKTIEVNFSRDTYKLEIKEGQFGSKIYSTYINGVYDRNYVRLPKDLREFFNA
jgi:hypothetical protein